VNYVDTPPPLSLFTEDSCIDDLVHLDKTTDMSSFWSSARTKYFTSTIPGPQENQGV